MVFAFFCVCVFLFVHKILKDLSLLVEFTVCTVVPSGLPKKSKIEFPGEVTINNSKLFVLIYS